jgi:hypothetical protein
MRAKLSYVLPLLQVLLAVALLVWSERWEIAHIRQDMPGFPPSFILLTAINFPLVMLRTLASRYFPFLWGRWGDIALVIAIGMFWYWVSLNVESWHQSRRVFIFSWKPLRLAGDTIAVGVGAIWPLVFVSRYQVHLPVSSTEWLLTVPALLWSAALILLFGRDFAQCLLTPKASQTTDRLA